MSESRYEYGEYRAAAIQARTQQSNYYEKLVVLNGGTVALVVTAVLGPLQNRITHRYTVRGALVLLMFAIVLFLIRNFAATRYAEINLPFVFEERGDIPKRDEKKHKRFQDTQKWSELIGCTCTAAAFLLLTFVAYCMV